MSQANLKVVILTALPVEFRAVREFLTDIRRVKHPLGNVYECGVFEANNQTWEVGLAEIGAGDSGAALQTERAISFFKPQVVLFVGVAGGIKDVYIGHVVVSTKIYGYESGKAKEEFQPRPTIGLSSFALEEEAKAEARSDQPVWPNLLKSLSDPLPKVWVGPIAAGEKVVASTKSSVYRFLRSNYGDALAVEMEGYGFLQAVQERQQPVSAIVVRGISDLIDNKNDATHQEPEEIRQEQASHHASAFAFHLLANFDPMGIVDSQRVWRSVEPQVWSALFNCLRAEDLPVLITLLEEQLTPLRRDPLGQLDTLSELGSAIERLDDLDLAVTWVGRIIHRFGTPLEGEFARPVSSALQAWYDERRPSNPEPEPEKKSPGSLLIALDPVDDEDTVAFTAELHAANGEILKTDFVERGTKCSIDEVCDLLSDVIPMAGEVRAVEIFLSWRHLAQPVHRWKIRASDRAVGRRNQRELWRIPRNTLVRSLDRAWFKTGQF